MQTLVSSLGEGSSGFLLQATEAVKVAQEKMPDLTLERPLLYCAAVDPALSQTMHKSHSIWLHMASYASVLYITSCSAAVQATEAAKIVLEKMPDLKLEGPLLYCAAVDPALSQTKVESHSIRLHTPSYASTLYKILLNCCAGD